VAALTTAAARATARLAPDAGGSGGSSLASAPIGASSLIAVAVGGASV
jgi:hypothetical protein